MTYELKNAQELLLNKIFIQKGTNFKNRVDLVSFKLPNSKEIIVTYYTLDSKTNRTPVMELNEFIANHFI